VGNGARVPGHDTSLKEALEVGCTNHRSSRSLSLRDFFTVAVDHIMLRRKLGPNADRRLRRSVAEKKYAASAWVHEFAVRFEA
jgi:hypothetical protein